MEKQKSISRVFEAFLCLKPLYRNSIEDGLLNADSKYLILFSNLIAPCSCCTSDKHNGMKVIVSIKWIYYDAFTKQLLYYIRRIYKVTQVKIVQSLNRSFVMRDVRGQEVANLDI